MNTLDEHLDDLAFYTRKCGKGKKFLSPNIFCRSTSSVANRLHLQTTFESMPNVGVSVEALKMFIKMAEKEGGIMEERTGAATKAVKRWTQGQGSFATMLAKEASCHTNFVTARTLTPTPTLQDGLHCNWRKSKGRFATMVGEDYAGGPQHPLVATTNTFISHAWKHKLRDTASGTPAFETESGHARLPANSQE